MCHSAISEPSPFAIYHTIHKQRLIPENRLINVAMKLSKPDLLDGTTGNYLVNFWSTGKS